MKRLFTCLLPFFALTALLAGCAREQAQGPSERRVNVAVTLSANDLALSRAFTDTHDVDRVHFLAFKKADVETNLDRDYVLDEAGSKTVLTSEFPIYKVTLPLVEGATYRVVAVGGSSDETYIDYDDSPFTETTLRTFSLGYADITYSPPPELFMGLCTQTPGENAFVAAAAGKIGGELVRVVGGLSIHIENIPPQVTNIGLLVEKFTYNVNYEGGPGSSFQWVIIPSTAHAQRAPEDGVVDFDIYMFPTANNDPGKLYIEVSATGQAKTVWPVRVDDLPGVAENNEITFTANEVVSIVGDYDRIDTGFQISTTRINLDDDDWDGVTP
jgi:hypothetical protein